MSVRPPAQWYRLARKSETVPSKQLIVDRLDAETFQHLKVIPHVLEHLRRMPFPAQNLAHHPQRVAGPVGPRRVPRKLLVRQIGIVLEGAGRLHAVDSAWLVACRQFRAPYGRILCRGQVDIVGFLPLAIV